jgi:hypothetical protein
MQQSHLESKAIPPAEPQGNSWQEVINAHPIDPASLRSPGTCPIDPASLRSQFNGPVDPASLRSPFTQPRRFVRFVDGAILDTSSNVGMSSDTRHAMALALRDLQRAPPKKKADRRAQATVLRVVARCVEDADVQLAVRFIAVAQELDNTLFGLETLQRLQARVRRETPPPVSREQQQIFYLELTRVLQSSLSQSCSPNVTTSGISEPLCPSKGKPPKSVSI